MHAAEDPWMRHVPVLFRALADPDQREAMPRPVTGNFDTALATWGALHFAFCSLLGWSDVGKGLIWWYREGKPVDGSPVLDLIKEVWGERDLIDDYAAWAWKPADRGWPAPQWADPMHGPSPTELAKTSRWPDEEWWRAFVRRGQDHHHDPFYGGTDPLHLSIHSGREDQTPSVAPVVQLDPKNRRGVLITEGLSHWLADLDVLGQTLPPLGDRSWRIEVFDRRVGWLGEFRKSRITGRWFLGKHSVHMAGASPT